MSTGEPYLVQEITRPESDDDAAVIRNLQLVRRGQPDDRKKQQRLLRRRGSQPILGVGPQILNARGDFVHDSLLAGRLDIHPELC
jgi:hypothetical protein